MRLPLVLLAVAAVSFFYGLGAVGLIGPDESRYAQVSRGMLERDDWVTPVLMGEVWLDKPPLFYWAAASAMGLLGETEAAARLPSALAALATCLWTGVLGARLFGSTCGSRSALILASSLGMVVYGRAGVMDSLLTLTLTLGLGAYLLHAVSKPSRLLLVLAFAAFGLSVLAKGPVGLLLPLFIIGTFHAWRDHRLVPSRSVLAIAASSFLAVVAPWHIAILRTQGWEFVEVFLLHHNVDRFLTTVHRHPGPLYYYLPVLVVALFPWSAFLPAALVRSTRELDPGRLFLLLWIVTPVIFFSLAGSKLPGYIIPILPPCALLLGLLWTGRDQAELPRRSAVFHLLLSAALAATAYYTFNSRLPEIGHTGLVLGLLVLCLALGVYLRGRKNLLAAFWSLVASSLATTLLLVAHVAPQLEPYKSLKTLASRGAAQLEAGERLICYKNFYPQAHFYTQDRLGEIWTLEEFRIRTREWGRILTLAEPPRLHELLDEPSLQLTVIEECGGKVLAEARPAESGSPDG